MSILQFIFYLGIINIVFAFVWKWVFVLPISFLLTLLKIDKGVYFVKAFGFYLLVSLTALLTLGALTSRMLQGDFSTTSVILFPLIGAFILYMSFANSSYEAQKQAAMEYDYEAVEMLRYDGLFMIGGLVLYIVALFIPTIARNLLTKWIFRVIDWAYSLPIIGWLIGLGGILFLISMIWHGILASGLLFASIVGRIKKKTGLNTT